jgi:hypothetical protein
LCFVFQVRQPTLSPGQSASDGDITPFFGAVSACGFGVVGFPHIRSQRFIIRGTRQQLLQREDRLFDAASFSSEATSCG